MTATDVRPHGPRPYVQAAAGLLVADHKIVLVCQQRDGGLVWSPPGGGTEPGELLTETVIREVAEETGLSGTRVGRLAYVVNSSTREYPSAAVFFFEIHDWNGHAAPADPDITDCVLADFATAIGLLKSSPAPRRETEPLIAYLAGGPQPGCRVWSYRDDQLQPGEHTLALDAEQQDLETTP